MGADLGGGPIELGPIGKREKGSAQQGTQTVGEAVVVGVRVGVAKQPVETVAARLGFGFDLQRVVSGLAEIAELQYGIEYSGVGRDELRPVGIASNGVPGYVTSGSGGVDVVSREQQVMAAGARIAGGEDNIAGELAFNVDIDLLNNTQLKVGRLVK